MLEDRNRFEVEILASCKPPGLQSDATSLSQLYPTKVIYHWVHHIAIKPCKPLQNQSAILVAMPVWNAANAAADRAPCAYRVRCQLWKALLVPVLHSSHASVIGVSNMMHIRFHGMLSHADPAGPRISGDVNGQMPDVG